MSGVVQLAFMKSLAVWDDIEIYSDTIGLAVTLQLAQIDVDDFYSCNDMFHQTSVTIHVVGWGRELTTFSLKDKMIFFFLFYLFVFFFFSFFFNICSLKQISKQLSPGSRRSWQIHLSW